MTKSRLETLTNLAKRRGFVYQASEIYGGLSGFWDWGPYGTQMARNIKNLWWQEFVESQPNIYGLDSAIIQHPKMWEASGHVDTFVDPLVDCRNCKLRFRADHLAETETNDLAELTKLLEGGKCPNCDKDSLTPPRHFNMMFKTFVGPLEDTDSTAYLRPETAGAIFAQFDNVRISTRAKLPFGIAQIGKAFRNEISPRDFIFRVRELEQLELEYFVRPQAAEQAYKEWRQQCWDWLIKLGIDQKNLSWHEHSESERAHYAAESWDIRYAYPFGEKELWGIANRTDYDLTAQAKGSGKDLSYYDQENEQRFTPYVIEPSLGLERLFLALLSDAYNEEKVKGDVRVVLKLHPQIAPIQVAVLPLSKNSKLTPLAEQVFSELKDSFRCEYDSSQSIGKRYRRQDEIGTPLAVTIDFESLKDDQVTLRERDSMEQTRLPLSKLPAAISQALEA